MTRPNVQHVAATLVALLEHGPLTKRELQQQLGVGAFPFGQALAAARLAGYVTVREGELVELEPKGASELAAGRARLRG